MSSCRLFCYMPLAIGESFFVILNAAIHLIKQKAMHELSSVKYIFTRFYSVNVSVQSKNTIKKTIP